MAVTPMPRVPTPTPVVPDRSTLPPAQPVARATTTPGPQGWRPLTPAQQTAGQQAQSLLDRAFGTGTATTPTAPTTDQANAQAQISSVLAEYGLESLGPWAYDLMVQGYDLGYILNELRNRPEFEERFPAIAARRAAGLPPLSPAEYVATERAYDAYMHASGLTGMFDRKSLYTAWLSGDVSPAEAKARADTAFQAVQAEPLEVRAEMQRMFGVLAGPASVAYYLDPKNSLPKIQQQLQQAEIGGASIRSMYGLISVDEAAMLGNLGVDANAAEQGFGDLVRRRELLTALPGENGETISRQDQLAAEFQGDAVAQEKFERMAQRRRNAVAGQTRYRVVQGGVSGLGSAQT